MLETKVYIVIFRDGTYYHFATSEVVEHDIKNRRVRCGNVILDDVNSITTIEPSNKNYNNLENHKGA